MRKTYHYILAMLVFLFTLVSCGGSDTTSSINSSHESPSTATTTIVSSSGINSTSTTMLPTITTIPTTTILPSTDIKPSDTGTIQTSGTTTYPTSSGDKLDYDMSKITFASKTITYDGQAHSITIDGELPMGVEVSYIDNTLTNVGSINATAVFTHNNPNYNVIPSMTATLTIVASEIKGIELSAETFTYDGTPKSLKISGQLPQGVIVEYKNNNQVDAGKYLVEAKIYDLNGNYSELTLIADLIIEKASYDMTGIEFKDLNVPYDGQSHEITITGKLPSGVDVSYENNILTEPGTVVATAIFSHKNPNYNEIPNMTATLTITDNLETDIYLLSQSFVYDGTTKSLEVTGNIPNDVGIFYEGNDQIDVGQYTVTATIYDPYGRFQDIVLEATLTITKADYDMSQIKFNDLTVEYDGEYHSIMVDGFLPDGVTVQYENNNQKLPGEYTVIAIFSDTNPNYNVLPSINAKLTILNPTLDGIYFESQEFEYDGYSKEIYVGGIIPENVNITYENNYQTEVGSYEVVAIINDIEGNFSVRLYAILTIIPGTYDMSNIIFEDTMIPYDGKEHELTIIGILPEGVEVTYVANKLTDIGSTTAQAIFTHNNPNYYEIAPMEATLTIFQAFLYNEYPSYIEIIGYQVEYYDAVEIVIPEYINNKPVTKISDSVFYDYSMTLSITLPESIEYIGSNTFENCYSANVYYNGTINDWLEIDFANAYANPISEAKSMYLVDTFGNYQQMNGELVIPDGVVEIKPYAFYASHYSSVMMPESLVKIGAYAFFDSVEIRNIDLNKVEEIDDYAFAGCILMTSLTIPSTVKVLGESTFSHCSQLNYLALGSLGEVENSYLSYLFGGTSYEDNFTIATTNLDTIEITSEFVNIPEYAFAALSIDISFILNSGVQTIGQYAFYNSNLISIILPDTLIYIASHAFANCINLESIDIPESVNEIGEYAFYQCNGLLEINIAEGVERIGNYAISECGQLQSLIIPASVKEIGFAALAGVALEDLTISMIGNGLDNGYFGYIFGVASYDNTNNIYHNSIVHNLYLTDNIKTIESYAFYNCGFLYGVVLSSNVMDIGEYAFAETYISNTIDFKNVRNIGEYAFANCRIQGIVLKNVETIGAYAFSRCTSLASAQFADSLSLIGEEAFSGCKALNSFKFPTSNVNVGPRAFSGCTSLTDIVIPKNVIVGYGIFENCTAITNLTLAYIGDGQQNEYFSYIFGGNSYQDNYLYRSQLANLQSITMTDILEIPNYAFYGCENNFEVILPNNIISIGDYAFAFSDITLITLRDSITYIGENAFGGCENLKSIDIPLSLEIITAGAFYNCTGVESLNIHDGVKIIEDYAFEGLSIEILYVPKSVESIGYLAFGECNNLKVVTIPVMGSKSNPKPFEEMFGYGNVEIDELILMDTITELPDNAFAIRNNILNITLPSTLNKIGNYAFANNSKLSSIEIPDSVQIIGDYAFKNYTAGTSIILPSNLVKLGEGAFMGASTLTSITIPQGLTAIKNNTFSDCLGLEMVNFYNNLLEIGDNAFDNCTSLRTISMPNSVQVLGNEVFLNCTSLNSVTLSTNLQTIGESLLYGCTSIATLSIPYTGNNIEITDFKYLFKSTIPNSLKNVSITEATEIPDNAFANCDGIEYISLPMGTVSIGNQAFYYCSSLKSINIPSGVESIGEHAFAECSSLTSISFPDTVVRMGDYIFQGCEKLTNVRLSNNIDTIPVAMFNVCYALTSISIPASVTSIGDHAFGTCTSLMNIEILGEIEEIGLCAFSNTKISNIKLSDKLNTIGNGAFENCLLLTSIEIPNSVTSLGNYIFKGCSNLSEITIPSFGGIDATYIGNLFNGKSYTENETVLPKNLTSVTLTQITSLSDYAFYGCSSIKTICLPSNLQTIGQYAFANCSSLSELVIPDTVTQIGTVALLNCSSLSNLTLPFVGELTTVGLVHLFGNNIPSLLSTVTVSDGEIGESAFAGFEYVTRINIYTAITSIKYRTFARCKSLEVVYIPAEVTQIEECAFEECISLKDIYFGGNSDIWNSIIIASGNDYLLDASVYYNL